ncbi:MAG: prepilin-type N-terminal cleavage/methylation domain-containing protein [Planctomycetota bacterium]|nr:MAG: prepilin-type N-terminal cleavage/methylation domain-containing protein [Planctomycetota bacterium]
MQRNIVREVGVISRGRTVNHRAGFTLVEILIVIVIISILIALLLPALGNIQRRAREARVRSEIASLEKALADFKTTYGVDPPSFIVLHESGAGWAGDVRSRAAIRRIWNQFNFGLNRDINGDGDTNDTFLLSGAECLVFFLGGMSQGSTAGGKTVYAMLGFSKNPANPFQRPPAGSQESRVGPFIEFDAGRLIDVDGDGMLEYADPLPDASTPYLYVSSYDGRGYPVNDPGAPDDFDVFGDARDMQRVYYQGAGANAQAYNPKSFQIISPGSDRQYGKGGPYDPEIGFLDATTGLVDPKRAEWEADNITNFHGSRLQ